MSKKIVLIFSTTCLLSIVFYFLKPHEEIKKTISKENKEVRLKDFQFPEFSDSSFIFSVNYSSDSLDTNAQIYFYQKYSDESNILCFRGNAQRSKSSTGKLV
jgi:hypothetical protein